jgi:hypothetical protein
MVDGLFFISSALNVKQLSIFNNDERYEQTVNTLKSIDNACPNNVKFIFDTSYSPPKDEYVQKLCDMGAIFMWTGANELVREMSDKGQRSLAETFGFTIALDYLKKSMNLEFKRFYKVSGRYKLNSNFILDREDFKDSFVFLPTVNSWMSLEQQHRAGVDKIFELRLWHMDSSLLDTFIGELPNIIGEMATHGIDVEHSYYKNLSKYKFTTVDPIGLEGAIAPTGEIINE